VSSHNFAVFLHLTVSKLGSKPPSLARLQRMGLFTIIAILFPLIGGCGGGSSSISNSPAPANQALAPTSPAISTNINTAGTTQIAANDPNSGRTFTYSVTTSPTHGTVNIDSNGLVTYTPATNYTGSDSLTITVTDNGTPALSGTVTIGVTVVNPASANRTMYHFDQQRTGYLPNIPDPQQLSVAWQTPLDGAVYGEPLVVGNQVLVATENDTVYSLDATSGQVLWQTTVGTPVPLADLPCGNIDPLGITSTPVYDPTSGLILVVAEVTGPAHVLFGLDTQTGKVVFQRSVDPPNMDPTVQQQRASLALSGGNVYIAFGGLSGDCGDYHGWVVASKTDGSGSLLSYQVPTQREGGIWATPGPTIDANGMVYVSVGNGSATSAPWDYSDSVLQLSPDLQLQSAFAPTSWPTDNANDWDLGSLGPVLLPDGRVFTAGKGGIGYLLPAGTLGGVGSELYSLSVCHAYGGAATVGSTIFLPCTEGLQQVLVGQGPSFTLGWLQSQMVGGSPVVGGNTIYVTNYGTLYALDANTGSIRASVYLNATLPHFETPTLDQSRVYIGTMNGVIAVQGS
jgi:VCBS repeat-containing protein